MSWGGDDTEPLRRGGGGEGTDVCRDTTLAKTSYGFYFLYFIVDFHTGLVKF